MAMFLLKMSRMVEKFRDAHTKILLWQTFANEIGLRGGSDGAGSDGATEVFVHSETDGAEYHVVDTVNGKPALDFLLDLSRLGYAGRKDDGAQLNGFLHPYTDPAQTVAYPWLPPQFDGEDKMVVTFKDGKQINGTWICKYLISDLNHITGRVKKMPSMRFCRRNRTSKRALPSSRKWLGFPLLCNYSALAGRNGQPGASYPDRKRSRRPASGVLRLHPSRTFGTCTNRSGTLMKLLLARRVVAPSHFLEIYQMRWNVSPRAPRQKMSLSLSTRLRRM